MNLAAYIRVSTDVQAEHGLGLEVQRDAIRHWATVHGHRVLGIYEDAGISGSNGLDSRVGLLDALKDNRADGLVVYRLDRLARDLVLQEQLIAELRRMGKTLFSTSAGEAQYLKDDPRDPSRKLIRQVLGAVSEYERAMIRLRLAAGRARKHENGGYAYGAPPFGYRAVDGELEAVPEEQDAIRIIRHMRQQGWSWARIAGELNAEHIATQRGGKWHADSVRRIALRVTAPRN